MHKTPGNAPGVSVHGSELGNPKRTRTRIQANGAMRAKLAALLWSAWWTLGGPRP